MAKIYIVRSTTGEMEATELGGIKVIYAFEDRALAEGYCVKQQLRENSYKIETINDGEFSNYVVPVLRAAAVKAIIFNLIPNEAPGPDTYTIDIASPANPRTFDFQLNRWLTAKESHRLRKIQRTSTESN